MRAKAEFKRLYRLINRLNEAYYDSDRPMVADWRYDMLFRRLLLLERRFPKLADKTSSPTKRVGGRVKEGFASYRHKKPLLSLENAMDEAETEAFIERLRRFLKSEQIACFVEPKIDGLSVNLCYENGILTAAASRGDGSVGEDITANLSGIADIPLRLKNAPKLMEICGEVYMRFADFAALNVDNKKRGLPRFANPRNAAAGSVRQLDASVAAARNLRFFPYRLEVLDGEPPPTQQQSLRQLEKYGFALQPLIGLVKTATERRRFFQKIEAERENLPYAIDGVVYKIDSLAEQQRLGAVSRHPRWAIARKFVGKRVATKIKEITVQVGRRGTLTPVAELEAAAINGVVVKRATLHNEDEISRLQIAVGDEVLIKRAGDVIPQVVKVVKKGGNKRFSLPKKCPSCGTKVARREGEAAIYCPNHRGCRAQLIGGMKHAVSRNGLDIEGLGEEHIKRLVGEGLVKNVIELFELERHKATLLSWSGWGEKLVAKILAELAAKRRVEFAKLLFVLGPPQVGERTAAVIAMGYKNFTELAAAEADELAAIDGIGDKTAAEIGGWAAQIKKDGLIEAIDRTFELVETKSGGGVLDGEVIVFTGSMQKMGRSEAKARAESLGGQVVGSVSAKTTIAVVGENAGGKLAQAEAKNLRILGEEEWLRLLNGEVLL